MDNIQWVYGFEPKSLSNDWKEKVRALFLKETGEQYTLDSISNLPIPQWAGNMLLLDNTKYPHPDALLGLMWALPHELDGVRIAAFVIDAEFQSAGWGAKAWDHLVEASLAEGKKIIQLEVKAENIRAQKFYTSRNLAVVRHLSNYYASGLGYLMKGPI